MQETIQESKQILTRADWIKICAEWSRSDEPQKIFCERIKVNYATFVYWRMKFKKEKNGSERTSFSTVNVRPATTSAFKVNLPNGINISFPSVIDKVMLKTLFELLGISAC